MSEISRACGGGDAGRSLVPGSLRGYRTWRPVRRGVHVPAGALPFTSVTRRRVLWRSTLTARCTPPDVGSRGPWRSAVPGDHRAPQAGCDCGIYAWYDPNDTRMFHARVFGAVEASGLVLLGDHGFRAEHVRVSAVVTRNRRVAAVCAAAGIPVFRRRRDLVREFPPDEVSPLIAEEGEDDDEGADAKGDAGASRSSRLDGFDRTLVLAVWARTALIAFAVGALPTVAAIASAVVAEVALVALIVTRLR